MFSIIMLGISVIMMKHYLIKVMDWIDNRYDK